ncbi:hypothetical protein JCM8097_005951 [Rhodosporidiobolus ruineniae]
MPPSPPLQSPSPPLSSHFDHSLSLSASPSPSRPPTPPPETHEAMSLLENLPPELIELVAKAVCRLIPAGPPKQLSALLVLSRRFYDVLGPKNAGFYADLFKERFDHRSIERRWAMMRHIDEKREKRALLSSLPELQPDDDLQLNPLASFTRPSSPSELLADDKSPWRPLTNRDYAAEFKRRYVVLTKMRRAVLQGSVPPSSSRPSSPRLQAFTQKLPGRTKLGEPDELTQNLWTCFLMLIENDGKNLPHLLDYAYLRTFIRLFYDQSLLQDALKPGWPRQTAGRALGLWIGWLVGNDLSTETEQESEQRFFVLKPYVFAAHKFDAFMAPWTVPSLPVTYEDYPVRPPPESPFLADLRPRTEAQTLQHMGRRIDLSPPNLAHAAIFSFFFRVEQDPAAASDLLTHGAGTPAQHANPVLSSINNGLTPSSRPTRTPLPQLSSRFHDRDFIRLASCIDPYASPGLPKLYQRGSLTGSWEGRFSFFDFDSYRDMLGGRMRSLYEGPFGDQPQVWKLEERVVRLEKGQKAGGKGPVLNAGFEPGQPAFPGAARPSAAGMASASSPSGLGGSSSTSSAPASTSGRSQSRRRGSVEVAGPDGLEGAPRAAKRARSWQGEAFDEHEEEEEDDDPEGEYEILLSGTGHSAWGQFVLKGRVRAWDGMFTIIKEYTPDSRGRWRYSGYLVGGSLVGRWRDTHTPVDMSGYEGTWIMSRRS